MLKTTLHRWNSLIVCAIVVLVATCLSLEARAGGYSLNGVSSRASTMGNAFTAVADDTSAIYYNPAGLTQIGATVVEGSLTFAFPDNKYTNSVNNVSTSSNPFIFSGNAFFSTNLSEKMAFGFGIYAPFARKTDYTANAAVGGMTQKAQVLRMDFVPTMAFDLGPYLSLGVSLVGSYVRVSSDILGFDESGSGYGFTGQGGILLKPHKRFRMGVSFRGPMSSHVTGTGTLGPQTGSFTSDFEFPAVLSTGLAWQVIDQLLIAVDFDIEMWSRITSIVRQYQNPVLNAIGTTALNADDSYNARFGIQYRPIPPLEIRVGYAFLGGAVPPNNIIPAQPDYDTHALSVGVSQYLWRFRFDLGYEFNYSPTRTSTAAFFPGNYSNTVHVITSGISYRFGKLPERPPQPPTAS